MLERRWWDERGNGRAEKEERRRTGINLNYLTKFEAVSLSVVTQRWKLFHKSL